MAIRLYEISKKFGTHVIHDDLELSIPGGEYHAIQGSSGCGKTMLLKTIAGFVQPDKGEIYIDGTRMTRVSVQQRGIGYIFQDFALFPHLTAFENIAFGLVAQRMKKKHIRSQVNKYAEIVGMQEHLHKLPAKLSGGQKQRIAIARALVMEPRVLLLDEPLSNLDSDMQKKLCIELKRIHLTLGITMVQVTHNLNEAKFLADKIHRMVDGKLVSIENNKKNISPAGIAIQYAQQQHEPVVICMN